jgi:hypothetical protein
MRSFKCNTTLDELPRSSAQVARSDTESIAGKSAGETIGGENVTNAESRFSETNQDDASLHATDRERLMAKIKAALQGGTF